MKAFIGANVLVYARDAGEPKKQPLAKEWIDHLWRIGSVAVCFGDRFGLVGGRHRQFVISDSGGHHAERRHLEEATPLISCRKEA